MHYKTLATSASFFAALGEMDREYAFECRERPCEHCNEGPLHQAHFMRKGFGYGLPGDSLEEATVRYSFCCGRDGCRKRMTPESLRFRPKEPYLAITFILVSAFHYGLTDKRFEQAAKVTPVSRSTLDRWLKWWREKFPSSVAWRRLRGMRLVPSDALDHAPAFFLTAFNEPGRELKDAIILMLTAFSRSK